MKAFSPSGAIGAALLIVSGAAVAADVDWDPGRGVTLKQGRDFSIRVGGRINADTARYDSGLAALDDGERLRRARAYVDLDLGRRFSAFADYEFGDLSRGVKNAFVEYRGKGGGGLRVGQFRPGLGLESSMSSGDLPFMERSVASTLAPEFLTGVMMRASGETWSLSLGGFGDDLHSRDDRGLEGESIQARLTGFHRVAGPLRMHLGAGFEWRGVDAGIRPRLRTRPESAVTDVRLLDSGRLAGVERARTGALELGLQAGPVLAYGERIKMRLSGDTFGSRDADGWQASLVWTLTGERRRYARARGAFAGFEPRHAFGGFELAARVSRLEVPLRAGGEASEKHVSVGASWQFRDFARVLVERSWVDVSGQGITPAIDGSLLQARVQLAF